MGWLIAQTGVESLQGLAGVEELIKANPGWSTVWTILGLLMTWKIDGIPALQYFLEQLKGDECKQVSRMSRTEYRRGGEKAVSSYKARLKRLALAGRYEDALKEAYESAEMVNSTVKKVSDVPTLSDVPTPPAVTVDPDEVWKKVSDAPEPKKIMDMVKSFLAKISDMCGGNMMIIVVIAVAVLFLFGGKIGCSSTPQ